MRINKIKELAGGATTPKAPALFYFMDNLTNRQKRSIRMKAAKERGNHTRWEWHEMLAFFQFTCCACLGESGLSNVEKDHIIPVYQGGSNHIRNLQPLCARCNASKGANVSDWRPQLADHLNKELPELYTNPF